MYSKKGNYVPLTYFWSWYFMNFTSTLRPYFLSNQLLALYEQTTRKKGTISFRAATIFQAT